MDRQHDWATTDKTTGTTALSLPCIALTPTLIFDTGACTLRQNDQEIALTGRECELLALLLKAPGRYLSTETLADHLSHFNAFVIEKHSIEQTIHNLRRKLGDDGKHPQLLRLKRRRGYGIFPQKQNAI